MALSRAALVAISTLFTKQHKVADVIAGIALALTANAVCLCSYSRSDIPGSDSRLAPALAFCGEAAGAWRLWQDRRSETPRLTRIA